MPTTPLSALLFAAAVASGTTALPMTASGTDVLTLEMRNAWPLSRTEERALRPRDLFTECRFCPEMVVVPSGQYLMGSPPDEELRSDSEGPQHIVTFDAPFAVGRYAVTFDEWDDCVADGGCNRHKPSDRGWGRGQRPVIGLY